MSTLMGARESSELRRNLTPVVGNDWRHIEVAEVAGFRPTLPLSVVIPAWNSHATLPLTLASVALQEFPRHLLEVIVVDDGSEPTLSAHTEGLERVRIHRLERESDFGSGRARRAGAEVADGDVILFLDSDMVLEPHALLAHARWHHAFGAAVTIGRRQHTDFDGWTPSDLLRVRTVVDFQQLIGDRECWSVDYIERKLEETEVLTLESDQVFRIAAGGNLAVSRAFYDEVGGFPAFGLRGIEDTLFGYRCYNAGAVFVYEELATGWHHGRSFFQGEQAAQARQNREGKLTNHLPNRTYRRPQRGRSYLVPMIRVHAAQADATEPAVRAVVDALLASDVHDLQVSLTVRDTEPAVLSHLSDLYLGDPRVVVGTTPIPLEQAEVEGIPVQVVLRAPALFAPDTLAQLLAELDVVPAGALHVTVPGGPPGELVHVVRTRAHGRARRTARGGDLMPVVGELFGERWIAGSSVGVVAASADGARPKEPKVATPAPPSTRKPEPDKPAASKPAPKAGASPWADVKASAKPATTTPTPPKSAKPNAGTKIEVSPEAQASRAPATPAMSRQQLDDLAQLLHAVLAAKLPADAVVAVVTKGDDRFLVATLGDRPGGHFPQTPQGVWAGFHPRDDEQALEELHRCAARGFTHLLIPNPYLWWLDHYLGLAHSLVGHALFHDLEVGAVFSIAPGDPGPAPQGGQESDAATAGVPRAESGRRRSRSEVLRAIFRP